MRLEQEHNEAMTKTTQRTDVHSPVNLVTEDYEYITCYDTQAPMWAANDFALENIGKVNANPDTGDRGMNQCHHCGSWLRYVAVLEHTPSGHYIAVGETCLDNRFEKATGEFQKARKQASLDRKAQRIRKLVAETLAANPDLPEWMGIRKWEDRKAAMPEASNCNSFILDVSQKLNNYGTLSERQVAAVLKSLVKDQEYAARKATQAAEKAANPDGPVPTGSKLDIEGVIVSRKWRDSDYGGGFKLVVKLDNGSAIWFSEPGKFTVGVGDAIACRFSTVTAADDNESFGFGKRPSRFVVTAEAPEEEG